MFDPYILKYINPFLKSQNKYMTYNEYVTEMGMRGLHGMVVSYRTNRCGEREIYRKRSEIHRKKNSLVPTTFFFSENSENELRHLRKAYDCCELRLTARHGQHHVPGPHSLQAQPLWVTPPTFATILPIVARTYYR